MMRRLPAPIAFDDTYMYVTDELNHRVLRVDPGTETVDGWLGRVGPNAAELIGDHVVYHLVSERWEHQA